MLRCLKRAFGRCWLEIMNSDPCSHFTNKDYLELLDKAGVKVSMGGNGRATDNSRASNSFAPSGNNAITSTNSKILVHCVKDCLAMSNFTMRSASTSHSAQHAPFSSTLMKPSNTHPNHWKEDITYFLRKRVLTLGGIQFFTLSFLFRFIKSFHLLP